MMMSNIRRICFLSAAFTGAAMAFSIVPSSSRAIIALTTKSSSSSSPPPPSLVYAAAPRDYSDVSPYAKDVPSLHQATARSLTLAVVSLAVLVAPLHANADEWGRETEAPTLFTGETVMICKRRGPLGACLETTVRTSENDNDRALKYFKDPSAEVRRRQERSLQTLNEDSEGNALIQKLRKQSSDNKDKNDMIVRQKTLLNDQGASFGPFDRQVVILNTDGRTFTLLQNPQAMRLKKAGYIEDRKFIIQPSQDVIDDALEGKNEFGDAIKGFFGGSGGGGSEVIQEAKVEGNAVESTSVSSEEGLVAESSFDTAVLSDK